MNNPSIGTNTSFNVAQAIASGDIQTLIQMVQGERVRLMDVQLVEQVKQVQARNDQIAKLNEVLSGLNSFSNNIEGKDATDKPSDWNDDKVKQFEGPLNDSIAAAGISDLGFESRSGKNGAGDTIKGTHVVNGDTTKGEIESAISKVKGMIDAESNNQQMDMLRLQSLNNKKNESVEILTTTQKKHSDATSNIIRNF